MEAAMARSRSIQLSKDEYGTRLWKKARKKMEKRPLGRSKSGDGHGP